MSWHGWLIFSIVALALIAFPLWVFGQFLRARREETETVLRKGLTAEAEIIGYAPHLQGATVQYRFLATGWENPIAVTQRLPRGSKFTVGDKVAIRYLPTHPHISVIVPEAPHTPRKT
ncbi:MAG TPA: hypothetical protein VGR01_01160 [Burkholderiales bacterium]|jgi:hypothetical protein|nr:hypothetical protein [Burkholderiales bacterium]